MSIFKKFRESAEQQPRLVPFTHDWDQFKFRKDVHNIDAYKEGKFPGRYYIIPPTDDNPEKRAYPSATTILGQIADLQGENGWLQAWRDAVGEEEADRVSHEARTRGTSMHDMAELYIRNEVVKDTHMRGWSLFRKLRPYLDKIDNVHCLEHALYSDVLQIAGRVDCIGEYDEDYTLEGVLNKDGGAYDVEFNGLITLIDFKSSRKEKSAKDIGGYKRQISLYAMAFEEMTDIRIDFGMILMGIDTMTETKQPGAKPFEVFLGDYKKTTIDEIAKVHEHFGNESFSIEKAYDKFL